jgi:hypothetical protein
VSWILGAEYSEIELGEIETGRSFTPRGDKDCHHRNVNGVVVVRKDSQGIYRTKFWDDSLNFDIDIGYRKLTPYLNWTSDRRDVGKHTVYANCYFDGKLFKTRLAFYDHLVIVDDKGFHPHLPRSRTSELTWTATSPRLPKDQLQGKCTAFKRWKEKYSFSTNTCHVDGEYIECWQTASYDVPYIGPAGVPLYYTVYTGMQEATVEKYFYDVTLRRDGNGHVTGMVFRHSDGTSVVIGDGDRDPFWATNPDQDHASTLQSFNDQVLPSIKRWAMRSLADLEQAVPRDYIPKDKKTEIISKAVDDAKVLTINSVAFLRDLYHIKELITPILKLKKKPMNVKSWANLWLTYDYGIRLLIQDIHDVVTNLPKSDVKFSLTHVRAAEHGTAQGSIQDYDVEYHAKLLMDPKIGDMCSILDKLRRLDLILSRENLWDFVPYSFVVDWFFPIGEKLAQMDLQSDLVLLGAKTAILSSKASVRDLHLSHRMKADNGQYNWASCELSANVYWRWHDIPSISVLDVEFSNGLNLHRGANGMALVVQKIKP